MACELAISNPLTTDPPNPFVDFSILRKKLGEGVARQIMLRHSDYVVQTSEWEEHFSGIYEDVQALVAHDPTKPEQLYAQVWPLLDDHETVHAPGGCAQWR